MVFLTCMIKTSAVSDGRLNLCGCLKCGGVNHGFMGVAGYECFGQVVLPHGLSENFNVDGPVLQKQGTF